MQRILIGAALAALLVAGAAAQQPSTMKVFEGTLAMPTPAGAPASVRLSVQTWGIKGDRRGRAVAQAIPIQGFTLAHLLSGEIEATIDGRATRHLPGDYWAVKAGATLQVTALNDYAMLETTLISKP
jgi:quercetin dioxygenase-like cupin family protein